jgi:hypothetical protein
VGARAGGGAGGGFALEASLRASPIIGRIIDVDGARTARSGSGGALDFFSREVVPGRGGPISRGAGPALEVPPVAPEVTGDSGSLDSTNASVTSTVDGSSVHSSFWSGVTTASFRTGPAGFEGTGGFWGPIARC